MTLMSASDTVLLFYGGMTLFLIHNCLWANGPPTESSSFPVRLNATSFHFILFCAAHCASPLWFFPHWTQLGQKVFFWQTNFPFTRGCQLRATSGIQARSIFTMWPSYLIHLHLGAHGHWHFVHMTELMPTHYERWIFPIWPFLLMSALMSNLNNTFILPVLMPWTSTTLSSGT